MSAAFIKKKQDPENPAEDQKVSVRDFAKRILEAAIRSEPKPAVVAINPLFAPRRLFIQFDMHQPPKVVIQSNTGSNSNISAIITEERCALEQVIGLIKSPPPQVAPLEQELHTQESVTGSMAHQVSMASEESDSEDIFHNVGKYSAPEPHVEPSTRVSSPVDVAVKTPTINPLFQVPKSLAASSSNLSGHSKKAAKRRRDPNDMDDDTYLDYGMASSQVQGHLQFSTTVVETDDSS